MKIHPMARYFIEDSLEFLGKALAVLVIGYAFGIGLVVGITSSKSYSMLANGNVLVLSVLKTSNK